ncbi:type II secretion system protein [Methylorubrum populi]|uniref:Type II secretion system protein n=1 Tax=Methylorubrum populi TaxID=223967 RepID=A0A833IZR3_9HYPH|nr:hypothetical protein [Methylorubrum populi]KAB7781878.1 hypothetical protein F8B43_5671 [Methylorubrum populi]
MFNLLVSGMAMLLAAVISLMGMFYLGEAFTDTRDKQVYAQSINSAQQIEAALKMYQADNGYYPSGTSEQILSELVKDNYLSFVPAGDWVVGKGMLIRALDGPDMCAGVNRVAGYDVTLVSDRTGCPVCTEDEFKQWPACKNL